MRVPPFLHLSIQGGPWLGTGAKELPKQEIWRLRRPRTPTQLLCSLSSRLPISQGRALMVSIWRARGDCSFHPQTPKATATIDSHAEPKSALGLYPDEDIGNDHQGQESSFWKEARQPPCFYEYKICLPGIVPFPGISNEPSLFLAAHRVEFNPAPELH